MVGWSLWISSMNRTSPFSRLVKRPASSPAFSITGPLVFLMFTFIAFAMINASVVLPSPDGPLKRMCSSTSLRFFAASTINSSRSRTFTWPANSLNAGGRSEISKTASGSGGFIQVVNRESLHRYIGSASRFEERSQYRFKDQASLQILRQHQLGAAAFVNVIHLVKGVANEMKTKSAWFDQIVRSAFHLVWENFFAVISQPHAHTFAQSFHLQRDELIVA